MRVIKNIKELMTLKSAHLKDGRNLLPDDVDIIKDGAIVFDDKIKWVGLTKELPKDYQNLESIDASEYCLTPELVDSHTHLVFAGNRANEYTMRLNGADYQEIANSGGGILATSKATSSASEDELFNLAKQRIERLYSYGIGTIEVKSGYCLTYDGELKTSKVIKRLKDYFYPRVQIFNTYLAAHAVPKTHQSSTEYLDDIVIPLLDELSKQNIIDFVDIFHEKGYFSLEDTKRLFNSARNLGLSVKIHADEFGDNKGAVTAVEFNALSADHLLCTSADGIKALAQSNTVATLLPGTGWFLGKDQANAKSMLSSGCKLSLASDYNPGSCHFDNLLMIAAMSAPMYPLNLAQMWSAITLNASHALGLKSQGAIIVGNKARFTTFKCDSISEITYHWGQNLCDRTILEAL